ncbi:DUF2691 family protein [Sporosarcina luteola]|uniref:DUF2691 family protein n=1 Tax=Sporosarcina luteola TaxID=582850 RepID=UPI00203B8088|nr:DUF2691 family protein [Sporosarcina luteola]MCM3709378.1 DUF2691 family protein [Sporosarcina luteola]
MLLYIKNEYGRQLYEMLEGIVDSSWYWSLAPEEAYFTGPGYLDRPFFFESAAIMDGQTFQKHISKEDYYLIFADIKAFPTLESVVSITNEADFMKSSCKLGLSLTDSIYMIVYSREKRILLEIKERAETLGYQDSRFLKKEEVVANVWGM